MQIHADTYGYELPSRYIQDMHKIYTFFTNTYTVKRPKLDMHAAKPLCEMYASACIMYVSMIYLVHICMYLVHICMYCLYLYVSMRLTNLAAKDTYRYIQYIQIYFGYIQDMHQIYTGYSKNTGMIYQFISYVSYVSVCIHLGVRPTKISLLIPNYPDVSYFIPDCGYLVGI